MLVRTHQLLEGVRIYLCEKLFNSQWSCSQIWVQFQSTRTRTKTRRLTELRNWPGSRTHVHSVFLKHWIRTKPTKAERGTLVPDWSSFQQGEMFWWTVPVVRRRGLIFPGLWLAERHVRFTASVTMVTDSGENGSRVTSWLAPSRLFVSTTSTGGCHGRRSGGPLPPPGTGQNRTNDGDEELLVLGSTNGRSSSM